MNDPFDLDRLVAKTVPELRAEDRRFRTREGVREGATAIPRRISSKATLDELHEAAARGGSPLVGALIPWVRELTVLRVTAGERVLVAESRFSKHGSISEIVRALLLPNANLAALEADLGDAAASTLDTLRRHQERVNEASRLLEHPRGLADGVGLAERTLAATEPLFDRDECQRWSQRFSGALASDAAEGWPVHLSPRWLASLFDGGELLQGVRLDDVPLPSPLGAASFARALGLLGEMAAFSDRSPGTPFSLARTPADALVARRAALFASIVLEPAFFQRKLGQSRSVAREQTRRIGRAAVVWLRVRALSALARRLLFAPQGPRDFEELSERALGRALPGVLLGAVPRLSDADGGALASIADACVERESLRRQFDEDWFENPRCHEALRHEHHQLVSERPSPWPAGGDEESREVARSAALSARLDEALHE